MPFSNEKSNAEDGWCNRDGCGVLVPSLSTRYTTAQLSICLWNIFQWCHEDWQINILPKSSVSIYDYIMKKIQILWVIIGTQWLLHWNLTYREMPTSLQKGQFWYMSFWLFLQLQIALDKIWTISFCCGYAHFQSWRSQYSLPPAHPSFHPARWHHF